MLINRLIILTACAALLLAGPVAAREFSGARALEFTRHAVSFGPRPPGSPAIHRVQAYIIAELKKTGCQIVEDDFTAQTPAGPVKMKNIIVRLAGKQKGRAVALSGHYDTKTMPGENFVGADDGGSSTGFLLEMASALAGTDHQDDIYLVWFDGEEAIRKEWAGADNLYGSRHLAERWSHDGTLARIKALINVDMIGDKDLDIMQEHNSSPSLRKLVWDTAKRLGYGKYFLETGGPTEDDHMPFLQLGVNALDLIDFDKSYWHTPRDTMDKLSAHSFDVVGNVLIAVIHELEGTR